MINEIKEKIKYFLMNRLFIMLLVLTCMGVVLSVRIFNLQIVSGEEYLENYQLKIVRDRTITSTRGNIYDRNGNLLAYDEIAYSVVMEDVFDNKIEMNDAILLLIKLIESNHDEIISDFNIYLNDNNEYAFSVEGTKLNRFLADVYGHAYIDQLTDEEKNATADDVMDFLIAKKKYSIGHLDENKDFIPGEGYTKSEILKIVTIRNAISANAYKKYVNTTVANNISDETIAKIKENSIYLPGVSISQDTIRKYNDSVYFSSVIGYTGKISSEEYDEYSKNDSNYSLNDYVGKTGIEYSMESALQGKKGKETIYVDNLGTVLETTDRREPVAGSNVYLTIDKDLQMAVYNILEQKLAGLLVAKIKDAKEYIPPENPSSSDIYIPIDDVYFALFDNNVIDTGRFSKDYASETEKKVYESFISYRENTFERLRSELTGNNDVAYENLSKEYKAYESYIVSLLQSEECNVLDKSKIDTENPMYIAWTTDENISLKTYLNYCITMNWINTAALDLDDKYSDSEEIYNALVDYIIDKLTNNSEYTKKVYKYMIASNTLSGKDVCIILWDQDLINIEESKVKMLKSGQISSFSFMIDCISSLQITPAQLALQPCSASCVVTDVKTGDVLALVSYPGFDSNRLANSADTEYLVKLNNDKSKPLWNYATQYKCAPGSTFKMVSSVAGLSENVITLNSQIECTGQFDKLNGTIHNCWIYPGHHGDLNVSGGIANSCNCFFYELGYRLAQDGDGYNADVGIERLAKYADLFGLSEKSGVEINEVEPQVSDILPVPSAIGQGTHAYTTVGLSRYVSAVANSGTVYNLTLIDKTEDPYGNLINDNSATVRNTVDLSPEVWNALHSGMREVVKNKNYFNIGVNVAGKTGTAQESKSKANHALFVGYAPYENPEISIATRIMNGYSSDYAAQISKDVIMYYYNLAETDEIITGTADEPLTVVGNGD